MKNQILTIPNLLTILRLILVPVFVLTYIYLNEMVALTVFILAGLTDILDGYLARSYNWISDLGKVLDPLADKTLRIAAVVIFVYFNILPLWILVVILLFDAYLIITSAVLYNKQYVVSSNIVGKVAAFFSMFGLILCFFHQIVSPWHLTIIYISLLLILTSIITYSIKVFKNIKK